MEQATARRHVGEIESAILQKLEELGSCTFEDLVRALPGYSWNQVFIAIDRLSRDGALIIRRPTQFGYVVEAGLQRAG